MKLKIRRLFSILLLASFLSGCATTGIAINPSFWQEKDKKIGVAFVKFREALRYRSEEPTIGHLVVGMFVKNKLKTTAEELDEFMKRLDISKFDAASDRFVELLQARGFNARKIEGFININRFPVFKVGCAGKFAYKDLTSLASEENIDILILFEAINYGLIGEIFTYMPSGLPRGYFMVKGEMINLNNNELLWQTTKTKEEPPVKEWYQPPDFPELVVAIQKAADKATSELEADFFPK